MCIKGYIADEHTQTTTRKDDDKSNGGSDSVTTHQSTEGVPNDSALTASKPDSTN